MRWWWMVACVGLLACGGKDDDDESTDTAVTTTATGPHPDAPVLSNCAISCRLHDVGDTYYVWEYACDVSDPQGDGDIEGLGAIDALDDGGAVTGSSGMVCGGGTCYGSDRDSVLGSCAAGKTFRMTAYDLDGHEGTAEAVSTAR